MINTFVTLKCLSFLFEIAIFIKRINARFITSEYLICSI